MSELDLENLIRRQEEIEEEVKKFKEQRKGLLPEFSFPEEEIEEEKEYPEEILFAFELRKKIEEYLPMAREAKDNALKEIEKKLEKGKTDQEFALLTIYGLYSLINSPLWQELEEEKRNSLIQKIKEVKDNALEEIESNLENGKTDQEFAWDAIYGLYSLINSPLWQELEEEKRNSLIQKIKEVKDNALEKLEEIESNLENGKTDQWSAWCAFHDLSYLIKSPLWQELGEEKRNSLIQKIKEVKDNALEEIESHLEDGKKYQEFAWLALHGLSSLNTLQKYFYELGEEKLKQIEHQKALQPERKDIPPRPEARSF